MFPLIAELPALHHQYVSNTQGIVKSKAHFRELDWFEFRIFIQNPVKLYRLSSINNPKILNELVNLLDVPDQAWAANITISKMLGLVGLDSYSHIYNQTSQQWWKTEGKTGKAQMEWAVYLQKVKTTLKWNPWGGYYKHQTPSGKDVY